MLFAFGPTYSEFSQARLLLTQIETPHLEPGGAGKVLH